VSFVCEWLAIKLPINPLMQVPINTQSVASDSIFPFSQRVQFIRNLTKVPLENLDNIRQALHDLKDAGKLSASDQIFLGHIERKIRQRIAESPVAEVLADGSK
jgi:hypothetical protein